MASDISPSATGYEPRLYSLEGYPPEQQQLIEKQFMGPVVDDPGSKAIRILIARDRAKLTEEMRIAWTRFLMSVRLRDPHSLAEIKKLVQENIRTNLSQPDAEYLAIKKEGDPPTLYEWAEKNTPWRLENAHKEFLPSLIDHDAVGQHIINMHWSTYELTKTQTTLLTGDRPFIATHGLAHPRCALVFPMSPRFLFVATNNQDTANRIWKAGETRIAKATNVHIASQARRHVYGDSNRHLRFVENRLTRRAQQLS